MSREVLVGWAGLSKRLNADGVCPSTIWRSTLNHRQTPAERKAKQDHISEYFASLTIPLPYQTKV